MSRIWENRAAMRRSYERRKELEAARREQPKIPQASGNILKEKDYEPATYWNGNIGLVIKQGDRVVSVGPEGAFRLACAILGITEEGSNEEQR